MMEFLAGIGALTILFGGFYLLLCLQANSASQASNRERLLKEAHWENYFWSWCQDPINGIHSKTPREIALKRFFTKERMEEAYKIIKEKR